VVTMVDLDPQALQRTREQIYPGRYGAWDSGIRLAVPAEVTAEAFDLVIIGTPPDTHLKIAAQQLRQSPPKVLLIEKPLCTPSLEGMAELARLSREAGTFAATGYNHTLTPNTQLAGQLLAQGTIGKLATLSAAFREYWGGIFAAHPWLSGPQDTYLGFAQRGGGASGEHSHAINIWQHFAHLSGAGRVVEVSAMLDLVDTSTVAFDRVCQINVRTENGLVGLIVQDVVTEPPQKQARLQGDAGFIEWLVNFGGSQDAVRWQRKGSPIEEKLFPKKRPDDFKGEIEHLEGCLQGKTEASPIALERGMETMLVLAAAQISDKLKRSVGINYAAGWNLQAIQPL